LISLYSLSFLIPLQALLDGIASVSYDVDQAFMKLQQRIDLAFKIGREEGFADMEIGNMIEQKQKGVILNSI
jgi:hypothetical protein